MVEMPQDDVPRKVNWVVVGAGAALAAIAIVGVIFVFQFVDSERQREMQAWQVRLGIIADSRAAAVNDWIESQYRTMRELAENASLQLYVTELSLAGDSGDDLGEADYLRNLLVATADRAGFQQPIQGPDVNANVERVGLAGLALTDGQGKPLVATPGMPPIAGRIRELLNSLPRGERGLLDMHLGVTDEPTMGFVMPIFGVQQDIGSEVLGMIIGIKIVDEDLFDRLKQPGETSETSETYIVRRQGPNVEFLSPLADGTLPLRQVLAYDTPDLASAFVIESAGGFGRKVDYSNQEVLITGRTIAAAPWVIARKVAVSEALAASESRLRTILIVFLLVIGITSVVIVAVWRHGSSVRATAASERFRIAAERFQNLGKFLRVVTDSQPTQMVAVTEDGTYTFANKTAADAAGIAPEDMLGKQMSGVIGPVRAKTYAEINKPIIENTEEILARGERISHIHKFDDEIGSNLIRTVHYPLRGDRDHAPAVLMIIDDITELMREREHRERIFRELVQTLVDLVGRRDPFSAHHASRVAEVATAIAKEMGIQDEDELRTIDIAAQLMNLGKTTVSEELLTRAGTLDEGELAQVRDSILESARMLEGVEFAGPVADAIRQVQEHWDGSGRPNGLREHDLLESARIIAVANAFAGMVSPRAYREQPMSFDEAMQEIASKAGSVYDRRAVSALLNVVDNRGGRETWAHYAEPPEEAPG